jgi:hypothetical protein
MSMKDINLKNRSIDSLKGEKWKAIDGYEDLFQVSSLGRIKALPRPKAIGTRGKYLMPARIKWLIITGKNVDVTLKKDKKVRRFNVARLVYNAFVKRINITDFTIKFHYKDNNPLNLNYRNLVLHFPGKRPVTQFDLDGVPIKHFSSVQDAVEVLSQSNLIKALRGRMHSHGGFFWRYGIHHKPLPHKVVKQKEGGYINLSLAAQLNLKKVNQKAIPPILNLSLKNIKGERWKVIEGYENFYQVSSHGRVKSLRRQIPTKIRKLKLERIIRLSNLKSYGGKKPVIIAQLHKNSNKRNKLIVRLVYYAFVKRINLNNRMIRFEYKDGNALNFHYKNIRLI